MTEPADAAHHHTTSVELLTELKREQAMFRGVMTVLVLLLIAAAGVAGVAAITANNRLNGVLGTIEEIETNAERQGRLYDARFKVAAGEADRIRESLRGELLTIREEAAAARNASELLQDVLLADREGRIGDYTDEAYALVRDHFLGNRLNNSTASIVSTVLHAAEAVEGPAAIGADRLELMRAASEDWKANDEAATIARLQELAATARDADVKALASAGLAQINYNKASDNGLRWAEGCSDAVAYADTARRDGLANGDGAASYIWEGDCLRKNGDTLAAFEAFRTALERIPEHSVDPYLREQRRKAAHGYGTTLIALRARGDEPAERRDDALSVARAALEEASNLRRERGSTEIGVAYTEENIGLIHLLDNDWPAALEHTRKMDAILPQAWNLTVRYIAATEQLKVLESKADSDPAELAKLHDIAEDAKLVIREMGINRVSEPELKQLLPDRFIATVDELLAPMRTDSGAGGSP